MKKYFEIVVMLITWFAILLQLYILQGSLANFMSYFTILSNLLVAISLTVITFVPHTTIGSFFSKTATKSAIALYILIVGLVYNLVLRGIWEPVGWQLVADNLLHVIVPSLYLIYWLLFTPKGALNWADGISWVYFPLIYLIYSITRGYFTSWYPYPFINVNELGYREVLINAGFMTIAFIFIGLLLIALNKMLHRKAN